MVLKAKAEDSVHPVILPGDGIEVAENPLALFSGRDLPVSEGGHFLLGRPGIWKIRFLGGSICFRGSHL
jgi:hypothetical protein